MKIVEALRKVYEAMGGTDTFSETDIANGIEQISEVAGGGGSGGAEVYNVTATYDGENVFLNKTYTEIKNAWFAGKMVVVTYQEVYEDPDHGEVTTYYSEVIKLEEKSSYDPTLDYHTVYTRSDTYSAVSADDYPYQV